MTIDRTALAANLRHEISTAGGTAYFRGRELPDPALSELFPEVAEARAAFEAVQSKADDLKAELKRATAARAEHKQNPEAVYTSDHKVGLVFSDPRGVELQNRVKEAEKALEGNARQAKAALLAYLVAAFARGPEAMDVFRERSIQSNAEAQELAAKLTAALSDRERYWTLAGRPVPGVTDSAAPAVASQRAAEQDQRTRDLRHLLDRTLPFPL